MQVNPKRRKMKERDRLELANIKVFIIFKCALKFTVSKCAFDCCDSGNGLLS